MRHVVSDDGSRSVLGIQPVITVWIRDVWSVIPHTVGLQIDRPDSPTG